MTANPNRLNHRPDCSRPLETTWPIPGGSKTGCPECNKYAIVWAAPPEVTSTQPASAYRCREHPGEPVTWKGSGCPRCPTRKANKRKAIRPSDYYTEERDR